MCKRIILLTGTPALAKPKELFPLVSIVRPDIFAHFKDFGIRYCNPRASKFGYIEYEGCSNL